MAALALREALLKPGALVLLLAGKGREQAGEIFRKLVGLYNAAGRPVPKVSHSLTRLELQNSSRVCVLPAAADNCRGFSNVSLVVIDEAAYADDSLFDVVVPMLLVSRGRIVCLSTPRGRTGFFASEWHSDFKWVRIRVPADECPWIKNFEEQKRRYEHRPHKFNREFMACFDDEEDVTFPHEEVDRCFAHACESLY